MRIFWIRFASEIGSEEFSDEHEHSGPTGFGRTFIEQFQERDVTFIMASLAYYAFVSLIPPLLLAIVIASAVGQALANRITAQLESSLPPAVSQLLTSVLSGAPGADGARTRRGHRPALERAQTLSGA